MRVELGPKEAASGRCVLARCRNPGEVADKQTVQVGGVCCRVCMMESQSVPPRWHSCEARAEGPWLLRVWVDRCT